MQITMRLYRQHDMDMLNIYYNKTFPFTTEVKKVLRAYLNHMSYQIPSVDNPIQYKGYVKPHILIHINLNDKKDSDIIQLLQNIQPRQRNAFLKAIIRQSLVTIPLSSYFKNDNLIMNLETARAVEEKAYEKELLQQSAKQKPVKPTPAPKKTEPVPTVQPVVPPASQPVAQPVIPTIVQTPAPEPPIPVPTFEATDVNLHAVSEDFEDPFGSSSTADEDADMMAILNGLSH